MSITKTATSKKSVLEIIPILSYNSDDFIINKKLIKLLEWSFLYSFLLKIIIFKFYIIEVKIY